LESDTVKVISAYNFAPDLKPLGSPRKDKKRSKGQQRSKKTRPPVEIDLALRKRVEAYLAKCDPAVSGHGGHNKMIGVVGRVVNGFGLDDADTIFELLQDYNDRCDPPWSDEELEHKIEEALAFEGYTEPRGHLLDDSGPEPGYPGADDRPCFRVYHHVWKADERWRKPGTYHHGFGKSPKKTEDDGPALIDLWLCTPLEILATTSDREDREYGILVEFRSKKGRQKRFAIPARWFSGRGDEVIGELRALGLHMSHKQQPQIIDYLSLADPAKKIGSTQSTGWYNDNTFVLPEQVIGRGVNIWYQDGPVSKNPYRQSGTLLEWQNQVAARAIGNPNLIGAICCALAGPLLRRFSVTGGGFHLFGPTTIGKTTCLECGQSVWGSTADRRSWRATTNGLEGAALLHTDTCLVLDEVHLVDSRDLDLAIYAIYNGHGKSRADKLGGVREAAHWRVLVLSSGEVSTEVQLGQSGINIRSGQLLRLLDIPVLGAFGAFDNLHGCTDGATFAKALKAATDVQYGTAGPQFVEELIECADDLREDLVDVSKMFVGDNDMQQRVGEMFAIIALAGETAIVWKVLPWPEGTAIEACCLLFKRWQAQVRSSAASAPQKKILASIARFIDLHGDSHFSALHDDQSKPRERAGYWKMESSPDQRRGALGVSYVNDAKGGQRIYLFTGSGLREATRGYDFNLVLEALDKAGAFVRKDKKSYSVVTEIPGEGSKRLYWVDPRKLE
jgi:putative DNA primase/helicase